jgi:hypothetical protein
MYHSGMPGPRRAGPVFALVLFFCWACACGGTAAQTSSASPVDAGARDGRNTALRDGMDLGRAQAFYGRWLRGFRASLDEMSDPELQDQVLKPLSERAEAAALDLGRKAGERAGGEALTAAWIAAGKKPGRVDPQVPEGPPLTSGSGPCLPAEMLTLVVDERRTLRLDPDGLERRESPLARVSFEYPYAGEADLRQRARNEGMSSHAVDLWVRDYKQAFATSYEEVFGNQRDSAPVPRVEEFHAMGRQAGRKEAARRIACRDAGASASTAHARAWQRSWLSSFDQGWKSAASRHADQAVVLVESTELLDADGDGLFQPGEAVRLRVTYLNAGSEAVSRSAGRWTALRGLTGEGRLAGELAPGERRSEEFDLGASPLTAPVRSSLVVRLRALGGHGATATARLGRPAELMSVQAEVSVKDGVSGCLLRVEVMSRQDVQGLSLMHGDETTTLERLGGNKTTHAEVFVPGPAGGLFGQHAGRVRLLGPDDAPWSSRSYHLAASGWSRRLDLLQHLDNPSVAAEALGLQLVHELEESLRTGGTDELPMFDELQARMPSLSTRSRASLEDGALRPWLQRTDGSDVSKRLRRRLRARHQG